MKVFSDLKILDIFPDYVAFKYEGKGIRSNRSFSMAIGMDIDVDGRITSYHCCKEHETLGEAIGEADEVMMPFKPSSIWR